MTKFSLVKAHDEFLVRPDDLSSSRPGLWPSETSVAYMFDGRKVIHGKCLRAAYYRAKDYPEGCLSPGAMMKMKLGKTVEKMLIEDYRSMGLYENSNVKFWSPEFGVSGELDVVLNTPDTAGKRCMTEVKSYYGYNANREITGSKRPPIPGKPKMDQFLQAVVYAYIFRDKIDEFRMLYFERGDGHRVEFQVGLVPEGDDFRPYWRQIDGPYWNHYTGDIITQKFLFSDITARWKELVAYIKTDQLPPRDYTKEYDDDTIQWLWAHGELGKTKYDAWKKGKDRPGDWNCSWCSHEKQCDKDSIGE